MIRNSPTQKKRGRLVSSKKKRKKKKTTPANGEAMLEVVFGRVSPALQELVDDDTDDFFVDPNDSISLYTKET